MLQGHCGTAVVYAVIIIIIIIIIIIVTITIIIIIYHPVIRLWFGIKNYYLTCALSDLWWSN